MGADWEHPSRARLIEQQTTRDGIGRGPDHTRSDVE